MFGGWFLWFSSEVFRVFCFLFTEGLQGWDSWDGFVVFGVFVGFVVKVYVKLFIEDGK